MFYIFNYLFMKKVLISLLLFILNINSLSVWAYDNDINSNDKWKNIKNVIIYKSKLNKSLKWKKFINVLKKFVEINYNNREKIIETINKINKIDFSKIKNEETKNIAIYIYSKLNLAYINIYEKEKREVLSYYWLDYLWDTFMVDTEEKCNKLLKQYELEDWDYKFDCKSTYEWNYWDISLDIYPFWKRGYSIWLQGLDMGSSIMWWKYSIITKKEYDLDDSEYSDNFWFIKFWSESSKFYKIKYKEFSMWKKSLDFYSHIDHEKIGNFNFSLGYRFKDNIDETEKLKLLKLFKRDKLITSLEDNEVSFWLWDSYNMLKDPNEKLNKTITVVGNKWNYFSDSWYSWGSRDIFMLTFDVPENKYFSEIVIMIVDSNAYADTEVEILITEFIKDFEWKNDFILDLYK